MCHLELEKERLKSVKPNIGVYMAASSSRRASRWKCKDQGRFHNKRRKVPYFSKKLANNQHGKGKCPFNKKKKNLEFSCTQANELCAASYVSLRNSFPLCILSLGGMDHVVKCRDTFMEFWWISHGTKWIYVGNNAWVIIQGIDTCKLVLQGNWILLPHDVLCVM